MGRNFRKRDRPSRPDQWRNSGSQQQYREICKENALLERYYNMLVPADEQEAFWTTLRSPLPATFRLVHTEDNPFLSDLHQMPGLKELLEPIGFVKNGWKLPANRRELRKDEAYARVHDWLMRGTEAGAICRQETVSMLPPLFMQIDRPDLLMLDMCAAPGSKTGQLLEYLSVAAGRDAEVTGMMVANDADKNRAFMLHHQVRRLHSPALLVTCNDASMYPRLYAGGKKIQFDRVLCDVPCSGDGTLRKTPAIWSSWTPNQAFGLHSLQLRILRRGLSLLKPGGRLVYSTCSLNPVEDEAVVAAALSRTPGARLVQVDLPKGLQVSYGRTKWPVMAADGTVYEQCPGDPRSLSLLESFFPPVNVDSMNLEYTFRVLPHHQDTGGFFISVFEREILDGEHNGQGESMETALECKELHHPPFDRFHAPNMDMSAIISHYLGSSPAGAFLTRSVDHDGPIPRSFVYCTRPVAALLSSPSLPPSLAIVNAGVRAFERYEPSLRHAGDVYECRYRILSELVACQGIRVRTVSVGEAVFGELIGTDMTVRREDGELAGVPVGGSVLECGRARMSVWRTGDGSIRPFISKQDRPLLVQLLSSDH